MTQIQTKQCATCKQYKPISQFCVNRANKDNIDYYCKSCSKIKRDNFRKTKRGVIVTIYDSQKQSSIKRQMPMPEYSLEEFYRWAIVQETFHTQFYKWVKSDYNRMFKPSVDRLNDTLPYTFSNIKMVSFQENVNHAIKDKQYGIGTQGRQTKAVIQLSKEGVFIKEYPSATIASKFVSNTNRQNIQKVCHKERPLCGGYKWEFK